MMITIAQVLLLVGLFGFPIPTYSSVLRKGNEKLGQQDESEKKVLFDDFINRYQRNYSKQEYDHRFQIFKSNLEVIDERNEMEKISGGTAVHFITQFTDLSNEECEYLFFGLDLDYQIHPPANVKQDYKHKPTLLTFVNWAGLYTTAVKNQGGCGSCWAFSCTEQVESDAIRLLGWDKSLPLAPQQLVDCVTANSACNGGNMVNPYEYLKSSGLELESAYPYVAHSDTCNYNSEAAMVKIVDYTFMNYDDSSKYTSTELDMANYVLTTGPLSIYVDAIAWLSYTSGIMASCTSNINHLAQIVGVDTVNGFWIVRNSWGDTWGESGYIRLQYMTNQCSLASYPSYVVPALVNLDPISVSTPSPTPESTTTPYPTQSTLNPTGKPSPEPTTPNPTPAGFSPSPFPTRRPRRRPHRWGDESRN